ncbi:MAG: enterotoxin, partial [Terracidiphilus sp.]
MLRSVLISVSLFLAVSSGLVAQSAAIQAFGNEGITARLHMAGPHLYLDSIQARGQSKTVQLHEMFVLGLEDQREIRASELISSSPVVTSLEPDPGASRAAARVPGRQICAELREPAGSFSVHWCMIVRGDAPYLRQEISIQAGRQPLALRDIQLLRFRDQDAHVVGSVAGSPIVTGNYYLGFEHPLSYSNVENGEAVAGLKRTLSLAPGQSIMYSSVVGEARAGQMRRDFLAYLELERAHPYRTFLHYNTWYDLGRGERFSTAQVEERIHAFGEELVRKRGVTMDSFLL